MCALLASLVLEQNEKVMHSAIAASLLFRFHLTVYVAWIAHLFRVVLLIQICFGSNKTVFTIAHQTKKRLIGAL